MRVLYKNRKSSSVVPAPSGTGDVIELFWDNWDDFGYKTTFGVSCRINGEVIRLGDLRILIEGSDYSSPYLDKLLKQGWSGEFPIPQTNYISTPQEITFYEQLAAVLDSQTLAAIAELLRDASFLIHIRQDEDAQALTRTPAFDKSLQRERGSIKAFLDGWKVFTRDNIAVLDLGFRFRDALGNPTTINFRFNSPGPFPDDINVLIGPNGSGKSQILHQIVRSWIATEETDDIGFAAQPNLSQIVVVSYSPFERFPLDYGQNNVRDKGAYRYFGFRGISEATSGEKRRTRLSHSYPKRDSAHSLMSCLSDDRKFQGIASWGNKLATVENVLSTAIEFDYLAVALSADAKTRRIYNSNLEVVEPLSVDWNGTYYIPVTTHLAHTLNLRQLARSMNSSSGVHFFKEGKPIDLSSGQRLFAYIVINIVGAIRRNSLILIDEPELFLHPTLEVQFVDMLKKILRNFASKALLATHSVVTVREVPSNCIHVFDKRDDEVIIKQPPFQTFGGDFQRISSYVFGDKSISKPFERWIEEQIREFGSADSLIETLRDELNEELIVQIRAMDRGQW